MTKEGQRKSVKSTVDVAHCEMIRVIVTPLRADQYRVRVKSPVECEIVIDTTSEETDTSS